MHTPFHWTIPSFLRTKTVPDKPKVQAKEAEVHRSFFISFLKSACVNNTLVFIYFFSSFGAGRNINFFKYKLLATALAVPMAMASTWTSTPKGLLKQNIVEPEDLEEKAVSFENSVKSPGKRHVMKEAVDLIKLSEIKSSAPSH